MLCKRLHVIFGESIRLNYRLDNSESIFIPSSDDFSPDMLECTIYELVEPLSRSPSIRKMFIAAGGDSALLHCLNNIAFQIPSDNLVGAALECTQSLALEPSFAVSRKDEVIKAVASLLSECVYFELISKIMTEANRIYRSKLVRKLTITRIVFRLDTHLAISYGRKIASEIAYMLRSGVIEFMKVATSTVRDCWKGLELCGILADAGVITDMVDYALT